MGAGPVGQLEGRVDVIVFDPDPIRDAKIVIQTKRHTNDVAIAPVRGLNVTIVHEPHMHIVVTYHRDRHIVPPLPRQRGWQCVFGPPN